MVTLKAPAKPSTAIKAHGYDPATGVLAVQFNSGGLYHYKNVPPDVAAGMESADSIGRYHGSNIAGRYDAEQIHTSAA